MHFKLELPDGRFFELNYLTVGDLSVKSLVKSNGFENYKVKEVIDGKETDITNGAKVLIND